MKIFLDTEFVERGPLIPLKPVSIGLVREDGTEFYGINAESLTDVFRHRWLSINALPWLPARADVEGGVTAILAWDDKHPDYKHVMSLDALADHVREFILSTPEPQLWAHYGAYDHVVLCQMFGDMTELPSGIPMYTCELIQEWERLGRPPMPPDPVNAHHALADARWAREMWLGWQTLEAEEVDIEDAVVVKIEIVGGSDDHRDSPRPELHVGGFGPA